jgi:hypothetical protein
VTPNETTNSSFELAQVNVGRLVAALDDPRLAEFMESLDPVNAAADTAPGFVWRLQTDEGNATGVEAFAWDAGDSAGVIINMSVWTDVASLQAFVSSEIHRAVLLRRRQWFQPMAEAWLACWWVHAGHRPSTLEAEERVRHLREHGPTQHAFTLRRNFAAPAN